MVLRLDFGLVGKLALAYFWSKELRDIPERRDLLISPLQLLHLRQLLFKFDRFLVFSRRCFFFINPVDLIRIFSVGKPLDEFVSKDLFLVVQDQLLDL